MPDDARVLDRYDDPYAWAVRQHEAVTRHRDVLERAGVDVDGLRDFLDETARKMVAAVKSQLVKLMAHLVKAASTRNPDVIGHWRTECVEFHDQLVGEYRRSMRRRINLGRLWGRALRKVNASFADHGEPRPRLPSDVPFTLDELIDPELDIERLVESLPARMKKAG